MSDMLGVIMNMTQTPLCTAAGLVGVAVSIDLLKGFVYVGPQKTFSGSWKPAAFVCPAAGLVGAAINVDLLEGRCACRTRQTFVCS